MPNKVCVITGGSSGIGSALVRSYASEGFDVAFCGRRQSQLEDVMKSTQNDFPEVNIKAYTTDVCDHKQMSAFQADVIQDFGRVDTVIANAGFALGGHFEKLTLADYRRQFEVNIFGVLRTAKLFLDPLKKSKGTLAIIGSVNSYVSLPSVSAYAMSKHALIALSESLRAELKQYGVGVTIICPGFVESDIRQRDKSGEQVTDKKDYAKRFAMNADKAAIQIKKAIESRKAEKIITWHGFFAIHLRRWFPRLTRFVTTVKIVERKN